ncbi:metaxin-like protein [Acrodontium crateriforme]|uniref:Metaxin-like protein n=1 Tax=Acrodontium crateriforme TaxID=150365 RepID=A0AAQ3LZI6_9PEZI|nr:metaxin-like protein [Acrodontium crateriforme]
MHLFVLGPAFGLPAANAECIAAIALLQSQAIKDWSIVPTSTIEPTLPLLVDGQQHISGFRNIARYVEEKLSEDILISRPRDRADTSAITSFLESNAQPLVDISLYVSFENYRHTTRPAFTRILPWHANYIIPPKLRAGARIRTEHLGVASIDVDNVHEDMSNRPEGFDGVGKQEGFEKQTQQRASLLLPRKDTLKSLLQRPERAATFKLHALANNFFEALQELLGENDYFLGQELTSLDCLVYGHLSLMLYPKVEQDWLASTMRQKYKKLVAYTEFMHTKLNMQTNVDDVVALAKCQTVEDVVAYRQACGMALPWSPPATPSAVEIIRSTTRAILSNLPVMEESPVVTMTTQGKYAYLKSILPLALSLMTTAAIGGLYYAFTTRLLAWPTGEQVHIFGRKRLQDYGDLGDALSGLSLFSRQANQDAAFHAQEHPGNPVQVDVAIEGDVGR